MKKFYFLSTLLVCVLLFAGCNTYVKTPEISDSERSGPGPDTYSVQTNTPDKVDILPVIDPLGISNDLGKNVLDAVAGAKFIQDYAIYPQSDSYKYKYLHETFNFMGTNEYSYYSYYTPLNASIVQSAEYEVYFDGTQANVFVQKFKEMYTAICKGYGTNSINQMGYTELNASLESIHELSIDSMINSFNIYKNGLYYISWTGPDYPVKMRIVLNENNKDSKTGKPFYKVMLTFDNSASVQKIVKNSPDAYKLDRNAVLTSVDPLSFTWLHLLGNDIKDLIESRIVGKDYETEKIAEGDRDCPVGAHTEYIFHPVGISFMGQNKDPGVIISVPVKDNVYSFSYLASFNKGEDLAFDIANFKSEYSNLCMLYGKPAETSFIPAQGSIKKMDFDDMISAISNNMDGMYSCHWSDTPDGNVFLLILNPSKENYILGRLTFTQ